MNPNNIRINTLAIFASELNRQLKKAQDITAADFQDILRDAVISIKRYIHRMYLNALLVLEGDTYGPKVRQIGVVTYLKLGQH